MTDRELLGLAAKAAGWAGWQSKHGYWNVESPDGEKTTHCHNWNAYCQHTGKKIEEPTFADAIADTNWNPLTDDGDALRLAVKLRMQITIILDGDDGNHSPKTMVDWATEEHLNDPYAATRRAITRAAAEIGKEMK